MRILFLSQVLPYPPNAGPKIRSYYVLRWLAERGFRPTLACFTRPDDAPGAIAHLETFCESVHAVPMRRSRLRDARFLFRSLFGGSSFIIGRDTDPAMHALVGRLLRDGDFDAVHADQLWMAQYALAAGGQAAPLRVLDQHNAVYLIPERLARTARNPLMRLLLQRERRLLARYEADVCRRFDRVVTVTGEDRKLLSALCGGAGADADGCDGDENWDVIPICVDPRDKPVVERRPDARRILILGTMFWPPNAEGALWFARRILPRVLEQAPDAVLTIVGKNPPAPLARLAVPGSHVEVTGYVRDLAPVLSESAVFAVPLRAGGGMRVKITDAWCWGLPIVSTTVGAEGIEHRDGANLLIADGEESFAAKVVRVLKDRDLADRLVANGRAWVEEKYDWRLVYSRWDRIYGNHRG